MPAVAVGNFRVFVSVDDKHLGMSVEVRRRGMCMQRTETLGERYLSFRCKFGLIAEENYLVIDQRLFDDGELSLGKLRQIRPTDLRADYRGERFYVDAHQTLPLEEDVIGD